MGFAEFTYLGLSAVPSMELENSGVHPDATQAEPDFSQEATGTDPSNQTASLGYDWIVSDLFDGIVTDSL
jgi:hypothetical protein